MSCANISGESGEEDIQGGGYPGSRLTNRNEVSPWPDGFGRENFADKVACQNADSYRACQKSVRIVERFTTLTLPLRIYDLIKLCSSKLDSRRSIAYDLLILIVAHVNKDDMVLEE